MGGDYGRTFAAGHVEGQPYKSRAQGEVLGAASGVILRREWKLNLTVTVVAICSTLKWYGGLSKVTSYNSVRRTYVENTPRLIAETKN